MSKINTVWHTLWFRLTAAFLLVAIAGVITVSVLANRAAAEGFRHYLTQDVAEQWSGLQYELAAYYEDHGGWENVQSVLTAVRPGQGSGGISLAVADVSGQIVAVVGGQQNRIVSVENAAAILPIEGNGRQVGTLLIRAAGSNGGRAGEQFLLEVDHAIWLGGMIAVLLALFLGGYLAQRMTRPLHQLTQATRQVAAGELTQQVHINSKGELGELATGFNQMSAALAASEQQRQQMLADIAHELRTPLSITRGHLEAMLDGVFEMTPDNLALIHEETLLLGRLVDDLRTLSLAEAGQLSLDFAVVNLAELTAQAVAAFEPLAEAEKVNLVARIPAKMVNIMADSNRIRQLFGNLISNALRHVIQSEKETMAIIVTLQKKAQVVQVSITDNGSGLSSEAQAHVFDRFWRADSSRTRDKGGSGLGLAISRAIVESHNGRIWVESIPGKGATFTFELPTVADR